MDRPELSLDRARASYDRYLGQIMAEFGSLEKAPTEVRQALEQLEAAIAQRPSVQEGLERYEADVW